MAFTNRIRLPFKLHKPQFPEESDQYRKANGETVTLSVVIRKVYEGITDEMPEKLHERLKIALRHDRVVVEGDKYVGVVTQEGDYQIDWSDFLSRPIAQAKFKAEVTPFNASNSNCGTCQEYTQVVCEDDDLGTVNEGQLYTFDELANDSICCYPITVTISSFNSTYVNSITVQPNNNISIEIKDPVPSANGVILATYRVTCDNGIFDEANIIANVSGSVASCQAPTNLTIDSVTDDTVVISWDQPFGALSYEWLLYFLSDLSVPVVFGTATIIDNGVTIGSLVPATQYRFYVKSICADEDESNLVYIDFITAPATGNPACGQYELFNSNFAAYRSATYLDCNGIQQNIFVPPLQTRQICALQSSPGVPFEITPSAVSLHVTYVGLC